jgi:hypothetical protein
LYNFYNNSEYKQNIIDNLYPFVYKNSYKDFRSIVEEEIKLLNDELFDIITSKPTKLIEEEIDFYEYILEDCFSFYLGLLDYSRHKLKEEIKKDNIKFNTISNIDVCNSNNYNQLQEIKHKLKENSDIINLISERLNQYKKEFYDKDR